jgi:hypothetical protein
MMNHQKRRYIMQIWKAETECPHPLYQDFKKYINRASYNHADDSIKEWGSATDCISKAADIAIEADYPYWAMERMWREIKPLASWTGFMHTYITKLKEKK